MRDIVGPFMMKWGAIVFVGLIVLVLLYILIKYLIHNNHESRVARFNRGVERDKEYFISQKKYIYKKIRTRFIYYTYGRVRCSY